MKKTKIWYKNKIYSINSMKNNVLIFFTSLFLFSCNSKENLSEYIPKDAKSVAQIDLPGLKYKALTWETIKEYLSSSHSKNLDFSIDLGRKAYMYSVSDVANFVALVPIESVEDFEKAILSKNKSTVLELNGFKYIDIEFMSNQRLFIAWKKDFAVFCASKNEIQKIAKQNTFHSCLQTFGKHDVEAIIEYSLGNSIVTKIQSSVDFNDGQLLLNLKNDENLTQKLTNYVVMNDATTSLAFKNDSSIFSLSAHLNADLLSSTLSMCMPFLEKYGAIEPLQYEKIKPFLDGRFYLGLSSLKQKNAPSSQLKMGFGLTTSFNSTDPLFATMHLDAKTNTFVSSNNHQAIRSTRECILFANDLDFISDKLPTHNIISLNVKKELLDEPSFELLKLFFGASVIESIPFSEIKTATKKDKNLFITKVELEFKESEKNSLLSLLKWAENYGKQDEI